MATRKEIAQNQKILYDDAVANNMFQAAVPTFKEFQKRLEGQGYQKMVFDNYKKHNVKGKGFNNLNEFRGAFGGSFYADENKFGVSKKTQAILSSANNAVRQAKRNIHTKLGQAKKFDGGRVTPRLKNPLQNQNVQKNEFNYNSTTGKTGTYTTTDGVEFDNEYDAAQYQNKLDKYGEEWSNAVDMGIVPSELDKADPDLSDTDVAMRQMERRQEWLNENQNRRSKELNESMHLQGSPFVASGGAVAPSSFNTAISNEANRLSDVEYGAYNTAKAYNQMLRTTLLQELKEQKQRNENAGWWKDKWNDVSNYFGAMFNTMLDPKLYSQGVMDAAISNNLLQVKKGMEDGTIKKGSNAGNAAQAMLGAIQQQQGEAAKQQQYGTKAYQYGDMNGRSLKFMADFASSGWRNVMTTGFTKAGEKVGEKMALGALGKWFTKNTGRVLGDIAGSAALAATNQLGSTYNNVIERYVGMNNENGGVTQDKNGDLKFNEGVSLGKAIKDGFGSATIENFSEMFGEYLPGAPKLLSKLGLSKVSAFFEKIGNNAYYKWLSNATNKSGIQGVMAEISEEEFGTALHAAWGDGDGSWSDFNVFTNPDAREKQIDTCLGMFYSVGFMQAPRTAVGAINAVQYFNIKHQVAKADKFGQVMFNDKWDEIKSKIDVTTNADLTKTVLDATRSDSMTAKQKGAVINYAMFLSKLRGFNQAADAKTKDKVEEGDTAPTLSNDLDDAYTEGHNADDTDKHNIQLEQNDKSNELAAMLHITPEQLHDMADEDLEAMTGQDDKLDQAIYDYQVSTAKYQGVMDGAQDEVDMAAHQAAMETDNMTDLSRGTVRKATIKATGGLEDYEVYIISGNIATHDDGSIDVGNSDDMIIYYDPTTGRKEHADAMMFADLIEELPAADVKAQAINDAKENAIKKIAGVIDGTVEVGSQFSVTDADGTEHTYEVLADNGDGTAMITIDGNVPTELVKGENVQIPYSFADLQQMKDMEDQKRLEAAKIEREQMEKERAEQQTQETEQSQPSFDFNQILNDNGNVVLADVLGKDGNTKYPNSQLFLIRDSGAKAKVVELKSDGTLVPHAVNKKDVRTATTMTLDEYKQAFAESSMIEENSGAIEVEDNEEGKLLNRTDDGAQTEQNQPSASVTTSQEDAAGSSESKDTNISANGNENNESLTFEDGTPVPVDVNGEVDLSQTDASHAAEWYDNNLGEDADDWLDGEIKKAKKVLEQAKNKKLAGTKPSELVASKKEKEAAIADAQAHYDSAISIRDSLKERRIAKEENTSEGRRNLIEKSRRKFARLKSAVKDDAEAVSQLYRETIGSLLHRLYDSTGIDVADTTPLTAEEYVASNLGAHSLNYEGTETSKGVKQETGLSREDFAKTQLLAADGKGTTIDALVHSLWENRPSNLESLDTQDIRNALIGVLNSGFKASEARNFVENIRIAQAENIIEEQKRAQENAAYAEQHKAEQEAELKAKSDEKAELKAKSEEKLDNESSNESNDLSNESDNEKINDNINDNINTPEVPEDATDEKPLGEQRTKSPFLVRENGKQQTETESDADVEKNKVDDIKVVDNIVGKKTRKTLEKIAKIMGANIQWLYSNKQFNGRFDEKTNTIYLTLDSSITEGVQFIFGHEMTHEMRTKNPAVYGELKTLVKDMMGEDAFNSETDNMQKRYKKGGARYWNDRNAIEEEVVADQLGIWIRDANYAHTLLLKMSHPLLARLHEIVNSFLMALHGTEFSDDMRLILRSIEQAYVKTAKGQVTNSETGEDVSFSLRQKPEPKKKGIGYKVFVLKDGKLYPPMVANPDGAATPVGVWLDADAAPIAGESKTGRPQVKQGGKGTQGGSGKLAYRPGWHLGVVPYAIQFNRKDAEGNKTLFPKNFVFAEVEYAADVDYQEEARQEGINPSGKYQHSLAGLKHLPTDGYYMYRTNPNPETDPWVITGAMKVNRILTRAEQAELVKNAGREPQQIQEGDIVTDDVVNSINQEIADAPKFSLKSKPVRFEAGKKLSDEEKKEVLSTLKDAYKVNGVPYHIEETAGGKEKRVYEPTADSYVVSDITNRPLRYYITLPDGRVAHPTEVYPNISDNEVKSSATKQGLLDDEADQIVSAAIGNMNGIADNAKAVEVLTELQNLPHETHDVGYGLNNAQSYNYKTGIFTSDAAQAIDYVVRRMRRKEDVPAEVPAALKKAVADSYGMVDNLIDGMSSTNFSLKDNQGNPLNQDGTLKLDKIKSVDELTDEDFTSAFRNVELPAIPKNVDAAIGANGKPVIIKKNIFEKNWNAHKFTPAESKKVLNDALYNTDLVGHTQPIKKPNHWVAIKLDDKSPITVLEVNDNKNNVEVVGWYTLDERNLGRIKRQAERNGGELIMLTPKDDKVESLSTPPLSSAAKIDNSSETTKENGEKFSLKDEKTLAGVHNISEEKLLKAIKQGGLANPSVAVIDSSRQDHKAYGGISLILPSDKIAKRTGKNAGTWQGDAYTPTYPQVERHISDKGSEQVNKDVLSVPKEMQHEVRNGIYRWLDGDANSGLKYLFLHEKGVASEPKMIQPKFSDEAYNELKFITAGDFNIYGIGKADAQKVLDMYIEAKFDGDKNLYEEKTKAWLERNKSIVDAGAKGGMRYAIAKENVELYDEYGFNYKGVQTFVRDVEYDHRKSGVDTNATLNDVEDYIKTNNLTDEFNTWLEGKEKEYGIKEVIFDGFTPSGNRRYVPNTLENVSKIMKKQGRNGATGAAVSFQNFAARLMPSYGTLKDIRSKKDLLTSDRKKFDDFREKWSNVFFELGMKCQPDATGTFDDYGLARLSEAAMTSDPQAYLKKEYNVDFSDADTKRLKEMVKAIKEESPAMYFETKFERPVRFDEFSAAVVPTTTKKEVKEALKNAGVSIFEYDEKNDADRSRAFNEAINSSDNIRFSLKSMMEKPEGWKQANKKAIHIAEVIERDPKFSLKNLDGTLIKAGTYFSGGGLVEEGLKGIIDPVVAVEYDEKISGVYRNNFGQHIVTADVRDVDPRELVKQIDGEVEYFHASPVCKNYSQAKSNHAEVELDKETAVSTAEFINAIKPKVVTIENVKGYKDSEAMKTITDALDANGYTWDADVYNAADYGGYTNRERLIVRAVRDGKLPEKPKKMARKSGWYEAVADIIPTLTEKKNGVAPWMDIRLKADGIDWRNIDKPLYVMGSAYADGKVPHAFADELLPTLRTKSGDVIVMPDGKVYRAMGRVLARVSGVSDDYKMPFSENLSHTIIGNGIPTQLTEHVIAPLLQNTLRPTTPEDGNIKFSLRYDQFEHDLNQWKKDNNLPKDAQRPTIPQRNAGESAVDFLRRVDEYRKQMALWKTAPTYEQHLLSDDTALGEFNRELQRGSVLKRIAFQDSMLAIRKAQEAIMKEVGVDRLNMAEDAYTAENRSHGKGKNEFEEYNNEFLQPLRKAYHQMKKILGDSYDNVRIYMMAKHGLERDAQMAFKKSLETDYEDVAQRSAAYKAYKGDMNRIINDSDLEFGRVDFTTWRQRDNAFRVKYSPSYMDYRYDKNGIAYDYSGLSALFDGSDFEEAAYKLVKDIEDKYVTETHNLWDATNAATKKILRDGYKAGMMSKDTYQYVRDMYSHYIPLRGWDGTTADQVWDYIGGGKGAFNQTLKTAHGRTSIADDPIAYIENMAESGILLNNKNWVKQHLMLLAQNHPTSLLTLSKAWYVKSTDANGNEEWIPATPQITSQMNSNQVKAAIDAFEKKMEQMAQTGDATQKRDGLNIAYPQTHSEEREHEVRVMKDGEEYVIYVNGDPQLAQAMNNTRAHRVREIQSGKLDRAAAWLGRKMAAAYTSLSPLFIPSNYFRDLTMTLASTAIREDAKYNYLLIKNLATSWNLGFMLRDYQNGKLRDKVNNGNATPKEQMFYDFMMNGGETGFVSSLDVEDLKKKFKNDLKDLDRWKANPVKVGHTIMDSIEFLNRMIEDSNRFAVYMTSIQYGRSIDEAVNDAKDVTLNFNRKGTGEYGWQMIRNLYLFINPAVQSLQTLGALAKHHPFKFTAVTASWLTSGVLVPIVNAALMSLLGGDDDKDKYWQFTKWDRRNNLIMWVPSTHEYIKIPLAQEFRAFYGIGDMIASKMMGGELAEESWSQYGEDLLGQVVDMLPLDPTGYDGNIAVSLMPNAIRPVFELAFNVDFTGKPLFKDTEYNKYDPNFTKAYVGTPDWLVRASRMVNSIGNDYPDVQQNSIDAFGDPRYNLNNPAVVDHVLSSYLGGAYTMGSQVLGVLTKSLNDPKEIKVADIPLFSKFVSNPDDRPVTKKQGDEFWDMKENHDRAANTLSKLKKQAKVDGDYSMLERFYGSEEYKQYKQDDVKVKKYEEDKKKERAEESGEEYRPHKLNAEDIYKAHATPKDDFEDLKLKQLYTKLNGFKTSYDLLVDTAPSQSDVYYNTNKAAIDAIDEIALDKQEISELKKGFLDDGKDAYNAEDMKQIRELRKKILAVLEKANKVVVASQKAKAEK